MPTNTNTTAPSRPRARRRTTVNPTPVAAPAVVPPPRCSVQEFIDKHKIVTKFTTIEKNPFMTDMPRDSKHFRVRMSIPGRPPAVFYFSTGPAFVGEPTAEKVVTCLALDCQSLDGNDLAEWRRKYGYGDQDKGAARIFHAVEREREKLKAILGPEAYAELMANVEI